MKKLILIAVLLFGFSFAAEAGSVPSSRIDGYFFSALSPYGVWMDIGSGVIAWRPTIMRGNWQPYSVGRWVWTDDGWFWDSYEDFGYITYHYGRWYNDDYYGWMWIPDYEWAPAWVEWRYDDVYIGWAPLSPYALFSINRGIHYSYEYMSPYSCWHFIKYNYFYDPYPYNHYVASKYKYRVYTKTKYRNNYGYHDGRVVNTGLDIEYIRNRGGKNIVKREVQRFSDPSDVRSTNSRDNSVVRTFIADRDQIKRDRDQNIEVKRADRKANLEVNKVELSSRNRDAKDIDRNSKENIRVDDKTANRSAIDAKDSKRDATNDRSREVKNDRTLKERTVINEKRKVDPRVNERNNTQINQRNSNDEKRTTSPPVTISKEERTITPPQVNNRVERTPVRNEVKTVTPPKVEKKTEARSEIRTQRPQVQQREVRKPSSNSGRSTETQKSSGSKTRRR